MPFSPKERDRELFRAMSEASGILDRHLMGMQKDDFLIDIKTQDAVAMRLQQILESASKISAEAKNDLKIDWVSMIAMRHRVSHHYAAVDPKVVWQIVRELSEFKKLIEWAKKNV